MNRDEKEVLVAEFTENMGSAKITFCADYRGLTVKQVTEIRKQLREAGCFARVYKNTLAKLASEEVLKEAVGAQKDKFVDLFEGPSFVIFAKEDPVKAAKILDKVAKDIEVFQVKGAWFDGSFIDADGVGSVAKMPGKEESWAMLLALINTPATQMVRVLTAPAEQVVRVIAAYKEKLEKSI